MSGKEDDTFGFNPMNANFTFNGNNTNYFFIRPGVYNVDMAVSHRGSPDSKHSFRSSTETTTNVLFPHSKMSNVPVRSNRISPRNGFGLNTINEEATSPFPPVPPSPSSSIASSSSIKSSSSIGSSASSPSIIFDGIRPCSTPNQNKSQQ